MSFRDAVEATPALAGAYRSGLQALVAVDRARISVTLPRRLCGSVNLDQALRSGIHANAHVWDYAVCHTSDGQRIHWIEVHPASDHGVKDLLDKLDWLQSWLASDGHRLKPLTAAYVWISSGSTTYTKTAPAARRLAARGVLSVGAHYAIR